MPKPITYLLAVLLVLLLPAFGATQSCPLVVDCPSGNLKICDISNNDSTFWNAAPYTWHPDIERADLSEISADISLMFLDTCPGALTIEFDLFLDLNGDNLGESVLTSDHVLPAGYMLYGNAFTPGYTSMDTLEFDKRPVPDSLKFSFVVETVQNSGAITASLRWVTDVAPNSYITPRYPEGRHHIVWRLEKAGQPPMVCSYTFLVEDCMDPQLECKPNWNATMPNKDTFWLTAPALTQLAMDNATPAPLLEFSLRRAGAGMGYPTMQGQPITTLPYTCADIGQQYVELWVRDLAGNINMCPASFALFDFEEYCNQVDPIVCATTISVNHDTIQGVEYLLETMVEQGLPPIQLSPTLLSNGCIELPDFSPYLIESAAITPRKNTRFLNGLSTFDLVLINRHILGNQSFDEAWKYWAADANNSHTVTTFDIIELRKLILGVQDSLSKSTSWKFFIADCTFDSLNPLQLVCPGTLIFDPDAPPAQYLFYGVKTGDVNGNVLADSLDAGLEDRSPVALLIEDRLLSVGEYFDIPIRLSRPVGWAGCQLALQWDTDKIEVESLEPGILPGLEETMWAFPRAGVMTLSWSGAEEHWLMPNEPLLTLRVRARSPIRLSEALLGLLPEQLPARAYSVAGMETPLQLRYSEDKADATLEVFPPQPNPSKGAVVFPLKLKAAGRINLELWDAQGRPIFNKKLDMEAGPGALFVPAFTFQNPGIYAWRLQAGILVHTGKLVRN